MNTDSAPNAAPEASGPGPNFIRAIVEDDIKSGKHTKIVTRFPPEPNGWLHIGHAKAITINHGIAADYHGEFHLRMDDSNPEKEETEFVEAIKRDVKWLGADWGSHLYYASDYFDKMYEWAVHLINAGKAYVDSLPPEEISKYRGTDIGDLKPGEKVETRPGRESPFRNRTVAENLDLFERMRKGEFKEGECVLRAKIDMSHPNLNMRDPIIYRIMRVPHYRHGDKWCIYPMYDYAHPLEDALEGITHSLCSLEFEDHRPLYDWVIDNCPVPCKPRQIEFARLNLNYTVMSKRKFVRLVKDGYVSGWDDPRMPTLAGVRRRGYPPEAVRTFVDRIGVAKRDSVVGFAMLEFCVREALNKHAPRRMAVLRPLKVVIDNFPEGTVDELDAVNNPEDPTAGSRKVPFGKVLYVERDDFMENPPKKFYRLSPGIEVRLRYAFFVKCTGVVKDDKGEVVEVHCTYDPATRGGDAPDGRKSKATLHWVSAAHAVDAEVRLYDKLFAVEDPEDVPPGKDFTANVNPSSLETLKGCKLERSLGGAEAGTRVQFERLGYFCVDTDSNPEALVFNRTVTLKDTWAKEQKKG